MNFSRTHQRIRRKLPAPICAVPRTSPSTGGSGEIRAFAQAREQDKPILLDIGAVWCHWCHVMDRESYENPEVARLINEHYVAVKVDRDERPDIDSRYQTAVSALTGQGGWPLTAFLTPDGKPFYGGTYFPAGGPIRPAGHEARAGSRGAELQSPAAASPGERAEDRRGAGRGRTLSQNGAKAGKEVLAP